jgi:hypothetical protein
MGDLLAHGQLVSQYQVTGIGNMLWGRNGGGDKYFTDGELSVGVLTAGGSANTGTVSLPQNPVAVQAKNGVWSLFRWLFGKL